jgi:Protein of unknown function (DUF2892)
MAIINIGDKERIFRVIVGLLLIGLAIANVIGVWGYIGVVPLVTALLGFCPAYSLLDINTCKTK